MLTPRPGSISERAIRVLNEAGEATAGQIGQAIGMAENEVVELLHPWVKSGDLAYCEIIRGSQPGHLYRTQRAGMAKLADAAKRTAGSNGGAAVSLSQPQRVLAALAGGALTYAEIAKRTGIDERVVYPVVSKLKQRGEVEGVIQNGKIKLALATAKPAPGEESAPEVLPAVAPMSTVERARQAMAAQSAGHNGEAAAIVEDAARMEIPVLGRKSAPLRAEGPSGTVPPDDDGDEGVRATMDGLHPGAEATVRRMQQIAAARPLAIPSPLADNLHELLAAIEAEIAQTEARIAVLRAAAEAIQKLMAAYR